MESRKVDDFSLDYSLKYAFQKYFKQVVEGQKVLKEKFTFGYQINEK